MRREFATDTEPAAVVYHHGLVLASTAPALAPLRPIAGMQLRVSTPTDSATTTEPTSGGLGHEQLLYATCSNLLSYPDATGARGTHLQPEIAAAMPAVSSDGRTYTFRVRSAYRFSPPSNERVTAETFRHTFERALAQENRWSAAPRFASDIVGVAQFRAGKAPHISGIRARGDTLSLTIARPSGDFLTRISLLWFCPVPSSVPVHTKRYIFTPVPSAGPYYLSSLAGDRAVLLRNPNYPGSRPRRAERIVYTNDIPTPEAIALTDRGALDLLPQDFDNTTLLLVPGGPVDRRSGAASPSAHAGRRQFFGYDAPLLDYIAFNTRRPLFRDARLRRAVNYALDRRAVAAAFADAPADQIVSPTVPGFPAGAVYPLRRDLATARRLVGDRRRHAVLFFCGNPGQRKAAQIVRSNLARIRIAVSIVEAQNCPNGEHVAADLLFQSGLESDEPDAAAWLDLALKHGVYYSALGPGPWNDAAFRRRIEQARPLRGQARLRAYARLDRELMRMAPVAVYGTFVWSQYLSPHVGCRLFQPIYGFVDLGALCKPSRP